MSGKLVLRFKRILAVLVPLFLSVSVFSGCNEKDALVLSGTVESTQIEINTEVSGKITAIKKNEGSMVKKGDVIAILDSSMQELVVAQQEAAVKMKRSNYALLKKNASVQSIQTAEADLEQSVAVLDQTKLILSKYEVKSPSDGTLISSNATVGDMAGTGTSVGTVSDLNDLWVRVYIPQKNLGDIALGQELQLTSSALRGKNIKGKIIYIASESEFTPKNTETEDARENTVFRVKIKILDNVESLKPGMTIDAYIPILNPSAA